MSFSWKINYCLYFLWNYKVGFLLFFGLFLLLIFIETIFEEDEDIFDEIFGDFWSYFFFKKEKGVFGYFIIFFLKEEISKKQKRQI